MPQKYKVYFANKPVVFLQEEDIPALTPGQEVIVSQGKADTMLIESAINRGVKAIFLKCHNVEDSWSHFSAQFVLIRAAGGVVANNQKEVLFIYRLEKWDLPKGKVEPGEELSVAALREVEEECSISKLELKGHLMTTYHTYALKGEQVLKSTDWFVMSHDGNETPKPQTIEGIAEVRWIPREQWNMVESNTFPSVIDVLRVYSEGL
jgi:8-oxo-dGTP pyrophosphatase MutT (NUDIX family)